MALPDETLAGLVAGLAPELQFAGLVRQRGGLARGIAWAECSGRTAEGAWLELRLHHQPTEQRLRAGMLAYQSLSRGGRTEALGEGSWTYRSTPSEVAEQVRSEVAGWLAGLAEQAGTGARP